MSKSTLVKRLLLLVSIVAINLIVPNQDSGMSAECVGGQCIYAASTSVSAILMSAFWGLVLFTNRELPINDASHEAGFWRRLAAFFIDFWVLMAVFIPIFVMPVLLAEFAHTGDFQWNFIRDFSRTGDWPLRAFLALVHITAMVKCQAFFIRNSKPTLGQYILGIRIIPATDSSPPIQATKRVLLSLVGLFIWPIAIYTAIRRRKVYFWDRMTDTRTVIAAEKN